MLSIGLIGQSDRHKDKCFFEQNDSCASFLHAEKLEEQIKEFKGFTIEIEDIKEKYLYSDPTHECTGEGALLSIQVSCLQNSDYLELKQKVVLALVCIGVFACCAYFSGVYYMLEVSAI